jgi:hypothetical protein
MIEELNTTPVQKKMSWLISDNTITVNFDGQTTMLSRSDAYADRLIKALKAKDLEAIPTLISAAKRIEKFSHGKFQVRDGKIMIDGQEAPEVLGAKIKSFADQGLPYEPLVKFAQKLQSNPSSNSLNQLYSFLEHNRITINEDGDCILYKKVNHDMTDCHTGTIHNGVGETIKMNRNKVDDNPNNHCSSGYHAAAWEYAANFQDGVMLEVVVNPRDVVSVPNDFSSQKMRICAYKVLRIVSKESLEELRLKNGSKLGKNADILPTDEGCENCGAEDDLDENGLCLNCSPGCSECGEFYGDCSCE